MEYSEFIKSFPTRTDIFDDITYLQKHLRLIIKFHQVSPKCFINGTLFDNRLSIWGFKKTIELQLKNLWH